MSIAESKTTRHVLTGLALVLVTAGIIAGITLVSARGDTTAGIAAADTPTPTATPAVSLAAILPTAAEYPPGFAPPPKNGIATPALAFPAQQPGAPEPEPCAAGGSSTLPGQPPAAESPAQVSLFSSPAVSGYMTLIAMHMGAWQDLSPVRTLLADCADSNSSGIHCHTNEYKPLPPLSPLADVHADDAIATQSVCTTDSGRSFATITYYGAVGDVLINVLGSADDPGPMQQAFALMVRKARNLQT